MSKLQCAGLFYRTATHYWLTVPTGGLIGCEDAFPRSHYPLGDVLQLLLLLGSQCWVLVSHGGWDTEGEGRLEVTPPCASSITAGLASRLASVYGGAATWLLRRQAAVRCGIRQGDNDGNASDWSLVGRPAD